MILDFLYLHISQILLYIALFLADHMTPVSDIVPVWFATAAVATASIVGTISSVWPWDTTFGPAIAITLAVDGSIAFYIAIKWVYSKAPGVN